MERLFIWYLANPSRRGAFTVLFLNCFQLAIYTAVITLTVKALV